MNALLLDAEWATSGYVRVVCTKESAGVINSTDMGTDGPSALSSGWSTGWCEVGWSRCSVGVLSGRYVCICVRGSCPVWKGGLLWGG